MSVERYDSFTDGSSGSRRVSRGPSPPSHGLSRPIHQKIYDSAGLRRYASSGSVPQTMSPVLPAGSLRVLGGEVPTQPGDERNGLRFLPLNDDPPLTPIDISPVTPRTPQFGLTDIRPHVAGSSPSSPDDGQSIDFHIHAGLPLSPRDTKFVPFQRVPHVRNPYESVPIIHVSKGTSPPASGRSTPSPQPYEEAIAEVEEEYAAACAAHLQEMSNARPLPNPLSREHGRKVGLDQDFKRLSTRSLSPPRQRFESPVERPLQATSISDAQKHIIPSRHRSPKISAAAALVDRPGDFDAAARDVLRRQGYGELQSLSAPSSNHRRQQKSSDSGATYPGAKPATSIMTPAPLSTRPKITPTPLPPKLFRLGSKLKSEMKGTLNRMTDNGKTGNETKAKISRPRAEKVEALHWTDY